MRTLTAGLLAIVAAACSSPTTPTPVAGPPADTPAATSPAPPASVDPIPATPADRIVFTLEGRSLNCAPAGGEYRWTTHVTDAGPARMHAVTFAAHNREPGCADTIANPRGWLIATGKDSYFPHESGEFTLTYDPSKVDCGRVQLDVSFLDDNGKEHLVFGTVVDYGKVCVDPDPPPPPPLTPTPPGGTPDPRNGPNPSCLGTGAILLEYPQGSERNIQANAAGTQATAQFSIAPGCTNVTVSLVSYQKTTPQFLPQRVVDGYTGTFSAGGPYRVTVNLAPCSMQADLYLGGYNPYELLDWNNWESDYNLRSLDWIYSSACAP
jgi:hypothetical protein